MKTGLVSVSFRSLSIQEIIKLCVKADIDGIEWGADVHVPPFDLASAKEVAKQTRDNGLKVCAYGSYYVVAGGAEVNKSSFEEVMAAAFSLGAPVIRVWAGRKPTVDCTEEDWARVVLDSKRIADLAQQENIKVAFEYHSGTLTDTNTSAVRLLNEIAHPNISSFWQPPVSEEVDYCVSGLRSLVEMDKLSSVHVFHWWPGFRDRYLLAEGADKWKKYLQLAAINSEDRYACLEFSKDDDPENFLLDVTTLKKLIEEVA